MPKVLVVDDNENIVREATTYLELEGWEASGASNGKEALDCLTTEFDAVVLDLKMPVLDGENTLTEIRRRSELDATCVVILTAYGEVKGAMRAVRLGAYQYIEKPFEMQDLHKILAGGVALQKAHALRRELLTAFQPDDLFEHIRHIITDTFRPKGLHILFLNPDGSVARTIDSAAQGIVGTRPEFVRKIVASRYPVFIQGEIDIRQWEPILANAQSLLAAPVMGGPDVVAGVIDLESTEVNGFDRNWLDVIAYLADVAGIALEIGQKAEKLVGAERALRLNAEALAESERGKRNQLVQMAQEVRHQFASPAQVIQMQTGELLSKEITNLPEHLRVTASRRLRVIEDNALAITSVCEYLSNLSGDLLIQKAEFDLTTVLERCGEEINPDLEQKNIHFSFIGRPAKPLMVYGDSRKIHYSVQCLLRNAIEAIEERRDQVLDPEFDPAKSGDAISMVLDLTDSMWVTLLIRDSGVGVNSDDEPRLFQPLFTTKIRPQPGGLGLYSVKRIIDNHNGKIHITSQPGVGTTFAISLPRL
jgi:signal transduction histidine kinase/CheY-like chemotaxis protein